jgi:hypothetical protein
MTGRGREASQRFAERRKREDDARRLKDEFPELKTLKLEIEEHRRETTIAETKHVRHVIVDRAPSLFEIPCSDPSCRDGGHDMTDAMSHRLRARSGVFSLEDVCMGDVRGSACGRVVRITALATYE